MARVMQIRDFAFYYGIGKITALCAYDLVVLQAGYPLRATDLALLSSSGVTSLAYLSIGETTDLDAGKTWYIRDPHSGELARNPRWGGLYVDCRSPEWRDYLIGEVVPMVLDSGFDGLFLDTVDIQDRYPATRGGVITLLEDLRGSYLNIILAVNRGFTILETVARIADLFVFEAFTTYYDGERYRAWQGDDLAWTEITARRLASVRGGRPVLALDYAGEMTPELAELARNRALEYGFLSFISTRGLDRLPAR